MLPPREQNNNLLLTAVETHPKPSELDGTRVTGPRGPHDGTGRPKYLPHLHCRTILFRISIVTGFGVSLGFRRTHRLVIEGGKNRVRERGR